MMQMLVFSTVTAIVVARAAAQVRRVYSKRDYEATLLEISTEKLLIIIALLLFYYIIESSYSVATSHS